MKKLTKTQMAKFLTEPNLQPTLTEEQEERANSFYHQVVDKDNSFDDNFDYICTHYFKDEQDYSAICYLLKHQGTTAIPVFTHEYARQWFSNPMEALIAYHTPSALDVFLKQPHKYRKPLNKLTKNYPFFVLSKILDNAPNRQTAQSRYLLEQLATHEKWESALRQHCSDQQIAVLDRLLTFDNQIKEEDIDKLPKWLTCKQPWEMKADEKPSYPELDIKATDTPIIYQWDRLHPNRSLEMPTIEKQKRTYYNHETKDYESAQMTMTDYLFQEYQNYHYYNIPEYRDIKLIDDLPSITHWQAQEKALWLLGIKQECVDKVLATQTCEPSDFEPRYQIIYEFEIIIDPIEMLAHFSPAFVYNILLHMPTNHIRLYSIEPLAYWLQDDFVPLLPRFLPAKISNQTFEILDMIGWHGFAGYVAQGYINNPRVREQAEAWLKRYPKQAVQGLLSIAFNEGHKHHRVAQLSLCQLAEYDHWQQAMQQVIDQYGVDKEPIQQAIDELLNNPPSDNTAEKAPSIPRGLYLPSLPQLIFKKSGKAIPNSYLKTVLQLYSSSTISQVSNGLDNIQQAVTEQSLASFNRELFNWYDSQGRPSKYRWMFITLGHTGNDETARLLAKLCKQFRTDKNRIGAYDALTMLTQIGSDAALMYINDFTTIKRFYDIQERADEALDIIAKNRDLTREQLADRTVPNLGLDQNGKLELDFGARQFIISFDEQLRPVIRDNAGKLRKTLPKPAKKDDVTLAKESTQTFRELKKQLKSTATMQIKRLESAMCNERKWSFDDFQKFFVQHPLLRHLSQRLAWGMYKTKQSNDTSSGYPQFVLTGLCRITEELSFTNEYDDDLEIDELRQYQFGVVHPLQFSEDTSDMASAFINVLQDYELLQPFEQLGRATYMYDTTATDESDKQLVQWKDKHLTIASLYGLQEKGWEREVGDNGIIRSFHKTIYSNKQAHTISLYIADGWYVYESPNTSEVQTVEEISLSQIQFAQLNPIAYSELQRDLHMLAWF